MKIKIKNPHFFSTFFGEYFVLYACHIFFAQTQFRSWNKHLGLSNVANGQSYLTIHTKNRKEERKVSLSLSFSPPRPIFHLYLTASLLRAALSFSLNASNGGGFRNISIIDNSSSSPPHL